MEKIIPAIKNDYLVICDRFNDSTIAYQGYGKNKNIEDLDFISNYSISNFLPDLTFYLDISIELSIKRRKLITNDRIENIGFEFLGP